MEVFITNLKTYFAYVKGDSLTEQLSHDLKVLDILQPKPKNLIFGGKAYFRMRRHNSRNGDPIIVLPDHPAVNASLTLLLLLFEEIRQCFYVKSCKTTNFRSN